MPNSPYTPISVSGYNSSPPADDGTVEAANQVKWSTIKTKLTDPLDTAINALEAGGAVASAFAKTVNTDSGELNRLGGVLGFTSSTLTIASGVVTQARSFHLIDTEASAASDDLDNVTPGTGMAAGDLLILGQANSSRAVTVKNAANSSDGAFILDGADFTLNASGRAMFILTGSSGTFRWVELSRSTAPASAPRGYISGLTLSNGTDATNDINIASGVARDSTNADSLTLGSTITKQLDAAWAVGTAQGGLDTGSIANDVYHMWLIKRPDTGVVDVLFSASATSPTLPSNYTLKRRIGSVIRVAGALLLFKQYGDTFLLKDPPLDIDATNPGTSAVLNALTVPDGVQVEAILNIRVSFASSSQGGCYVSSPDVTDEAASISAAPLVTVFAVNPSSGAQDNSVQARCFTDTSGRIRTRLTASSTNDKLNAATLGWVDTRGKDD